MCQAHIHICDFFPGPFVFRPNFTYFMHDFMHDFLCTIFYAWFCMQDFYAHFFMHGFYARFFMHDFYARFLLTFLTTITFWNFAGVRDHSQMTSSNFGEFLTPSPCVIFFVDFSLQNNSKFSHPSLLAEPLALRRWRHFWIFL